MVGNEHGMDFTGEETVRARSSAKRGAVVGGFVGAMVGARGGPVGAGVGSLIGGTTGYALGYALGTVDTRPPVHSDDLVEVPVEAPGTDEDDEPEA